jgi:hypothetical protein
MIIDMRQQLHQHITVAARVIIERNGIISFHPAAVKSFERLRDELYHCFQLLHQFFPRDIFLDELHIPVAFVTGMGQLRANEVVEPANEMQCKVAAAIADGAGGFPEIFFVFK